MKMLRLYADESGESHFGADDIPLNLEDDSPPAKPHYFSDPQDASTYVLVECPLGWGGELHPTPRRQIVVCTAGTMRVTTSLGESRDLSPGDAVSLEDTSGKGHISLVTSTTPFRGLIVRLE
jgi:quercetin dioxygenase-like cupin family protein